MELFVEYEQDDNFLIDNIERIVRMYEPLEVEDNYKKNIYSTWKDIRSEWENNIIEYVKCRFPDGKWGKEDILKSFMEMVEQLYSKAQLRSSEAMEYKERYFSRLQNIG